MKFSIPTNWQDELLPIFNSPQIAEVYGKLAEDFVGGGRPAYSLFNISKKKAARYIDAVHKNNCKFNYLLNASCLDGQEFTRKGRKELAKLLDWLVKIGVDSVTVSLPYLTEIIKKNYPSLKIHVSVMAHVDCIEKARFWETLGASSITLSHTKLNRDFTVLREIRKNVKCQIQLMANNHCLYSCPTQDYHETFSSHASQSKHTKGNFIFDYCSLTCRYRKISSPSLLISSPWIRPEDLQLYQDLGIDTIKLVDRRLSSARLITIINAYLNRDYTGNLADLFPTLSGGSPISRHNLLLRIKHFFKPFSVDTFKYLKLKELLKDAQVYIDNKKLKGFIDFFITHNCQAVSCEDCGYCAKIANEVVRIDESYKNKITSEYHNFLDSVLSADDNRYF